MQRSLIYVLCFVMIILMNSCGGQKVTETSVMTTMENPILIRTNELFVALLNISDQTHEGSLIEDEGWREYSLEIENISDSPFTIINVKLLNSAGRYVDSAVQYEQIIAPPDLGTELAGDVAETAAVIAAGQIIPYGGTIFSLFSNAASSSSAADKAEARRVFTMRVLKNIELAPAGKVGGSAFLPYITDAKALALDYSQKNKIFRIEIPLPPEEPES